MEFNGKIGRIRAFIGRRMERFHRPESLVLRAKEMLRTISPENLMLISPRPALILAGHPDTIAPHDIERSRVMLRTGGGSMFNVIQMIKSQATMDIRQAGQVLQGKMNNAKERGMRIEEGTRKSWFAEWKKTYDAQIARIKGSRQPKDQIVAAIREMIDDIKHHPFLTDKEKKGLIEAQNKMLTEYSAQS